MCEKTDQNVIIYQAVLMSSNTVFGRQRSGYVRLFWQVTQYAEHFTLAIHFY